MMMPGVALASIAFAIALLCAALMGYAIQRGGTCMVAAVEEVVAKRRTDKLIAMLEAGLWVAGGLLVARLFGHLAMTPANYRISALTLLGGAMLGLGALVNRACVFGSIARLGSGQWAYMVTPIGFYLGCLLASPYVGHPSRAGTTSLLFGAELVLAVPLAIYVLWRGQVAWRTVRQGAVIARAWGPHQATVVIGLAFVVMTLTVGNWAYTQLLADIAGGMVSDFAVKLTLFAGLLAGAIFGGWRAGLLGHVLPAPRVLARCLVGGMMMGIGGLLIPGSNDGLILIGLPLILPYALVALASMVIAIVLGMLVERRLLGG